MTELVVVVIPCLLHQKVESRMVSRVHVVSYYSLDELFVLDPQDVEHDFGKSNSLGCLHAFTFQIDVRAIVHAFMHW